jgi:hypothetical protein
MVVSRTCLFVAMSPRKLCSYKYAKQLAWVSHRHACTRMRIHSVKPFKLIAFGLVLSAPNIFISTSPRATHAPLCLHVYAHIGTIMPAHACTHEREHSTTYTFSQALSCPHVHVVCYAQTPMCVGTYDCDPAHEHNAHVGPIMPTSASRVDTMIPSRCMYT